MLLSTEDNHDHNIDCYSYDHSIQRLISTEDTTDLLNKMLLSTKDSTDNNYLDNNNWVVVVVPSFLRSLCEFGGDCFGPRYLSEGAKSKTITDKLTQWAENRWCKVILVINNHSLGIFNAF